jgi:hypothetical protein
MQSGRWWMPKELFRTNYEGKRQDLVRAFKEEEVAFFPVSSHDDMLDGASRILDPKFPAEFPKEDGGSFEGYRPLRARESSKNDSEKKVSSFMRHKKGRTVRRSSGGRAVNF